MQVLTGHTDAESAYIVNDYPYGFRLRCQMRVWVETTKHGQRVVRQTSNPKRVGAWNKPKASRYSPVRLLILGDDDHVTDTGVSGYSSADELRAFEDLFLEHMDNDQRRFVSYALAHRRAEKHTTYMIHTCSGTTPCEDEIHATTYKERERTEREMMGTLTRQELRLESNAALAGEDFTRA